LTSGAGPKFHSVRLLRARTIHGVDVMPSLQCKRTDNQIRDSISQLVQLRRQMLRFARSLPPGPERNERQQIACGRYGEVKNLQNKNRGADRPQASIFLSASVCRNLSWPNREIDKMSDESATGEERTERKRRLTRGPTELRQGRLDQPRKERFR
jgi:hypothetical protein